MRMEWTRQESAQGKELVADRYKMWLHDPIRDDRPIYHDHDHDMFTLMHTSSLIEITQVGENRSDLEDMD